MSITVIDY